MSAWQHGILPCASMQTVQDTFRNKHKKALCVFTSNTTSLVQTCDHVAASHAAMAWSQFDSPGASQHLQSSKSPRTWHAMSWRGHHVHRRAKSKAIRCQSQAKRQCHPRARHGRPRLLPGRRKATVGHRHTEGRGRPWLRRPQRQGHWPPPDVGARPP